MFIVLARAKQLCVKGSILLSILGSFFNKIKDRLLGLRCSICTYSEMKTSSVTIGCALYVNYT